MTLPWIAGFLALIAGLMDAVWGTKPSTARRGRRILYATTFGMLFLAGIVSFWATQRGWANANPEAGAGIAAAFVLAALASLGIRESHRASGKRFAGHAVKETGKEEDNKEDEAMGDGTTEALNSEKARAARPRRSVIPAMLSAFALVSLAAFATNDRSRYQIDLPPETEILDAASPHLAKATATLDDKRVPFRLVLEQFEPTRWEATVRTPPWTHAKPDTPDGVRSLRQHLLNAAEELPQLLGRDSQPMAFELPVDDVAVVGGWFSTPEEAVNDALDQTVREAAATGQTEADATRLRAAIAAETHVLAIDGRRLVVDDRDLGSVYQAAAVYPADKIERTLSQSQEDVRRRGLVMTGAAVLAAITLAMGVGLLLVRD